MNTAKCLGIIRNFIGTNEDYRERFTEEEPSPDDVTEYKRDMVSFAIDLNKAIDEPEERKANLEDIKDAMAKSGYRYDEHYNAGVSDEELIGGNGNGSSPELEAKLAAMEAKIDTMTAKMDKAYFAFTQYLKVQRHEYVRQASILDALIEKLQ